MKRFNVTVNGVTYDVCVEEVGGTSSAPVAPATTAAPVAPVAQSAPAPKAPKASGTQGAVKVAAPMPGTIIKVNANIGATVKKGDVLVVLEAMKMENDICAPSDGVVASVNTSKGASVNTDEVLVTLN